VTTTIDGVWVAEASGIGVLLGDEEGVRVRTDSVMVTTPDWPLELVAEGPPTEGEAPIEVAVGSVTVSTLDWPLPSGMVTVMIDAAGVPWADQTETVDSGTVTVTMPGWPFVLDLAEE
jgi:hypothetical protein